MLNANSCEQESAAFRTLVRWIAGLRRLRRLRWLSWRWIGGRGMRRGGVRRSGSGIGRLFGLGGRGCASRLTWIGWLFRRLSGSSGRRLLWLRLRIRIRGCCIAGGCRIRRLWLGIRLGLRLRLRIGVAGSGAGGGWLGRLGRCSLTASSPTAAPTRACHTRAAAVLCECQRRGEEGEENEGCEGQQEEARQTHVGSPHSARKGG